MAKFRFVLYLILILFFGCALPAPEREQQEFVPDKELMGVSLVREGLDYFNRGRFYDAERKFREALYLFPDARNIQENLAISLRSQGLYEDAEQIFIKLLEQDPKSNRYLIGLAQNYFGAGDYIRAKKYYEQALELAVEINDMNLAASHARSLSVIAFRLGNEEEARCQSSFALAQRPNLEELVRHARLLLGIGYFQTVEELVEQYLAEHPSEKMPQLLNVDAMAKYGRGELKQARETIQLALLSQHIEPAVYRELRILKELAQEKDKESTENALKEGEDAEEGETFQLFSRDAFNANIVLYWPAPLLEAYVGRLHDQPIL